MDDSLDSTPSVADGSAAATSLASELLTGATAVASLGNTAADIASLGQDRLRDALELVTAVQRSLDRYAIAIASRVAFFSRLELGGSGLAQREGRRTAEGFIQSVTGSTRVVAATLVQVGTMVDNVLAAERLAETDPEAAATVYGDVWQTPLVRAIENNQLRPDAVDSIRRGLGNPGAGVSTDQLRTGCELLVASGAGGGTAGVRPTTDELYRAARDFRDRIDSDAVEHREKTQHDNRYLKAYRRADGMVQGSFRLSPPDGDLLLQMLDQGTSPRRGGPRFVRDDERAWARKVIDDPRTNEQINVDTLIAALHLAANADHSRLPGQRPAVRVITTATVAGNRAEPGLLEDSHQPVSAGSVELFICDAGTMQVVVDEQAQILQLGREQRLFSRRQRIALAVRWGGCAFVGCERPPGWCEAHHVRWYQRDNGPTDIANGILLCRHHHMLIHNNGWDIHLENGDYWLIPPASVDPSRTPRLLVSKNGLIEEIRDAR
ncbi:HNH endonuclease signature motif containing protein [Glaciihabitans sp. dw_435]|uniref:HNH endonuclease signature motif containing protein n=1 Tax=Glaciihabitans sp. dw_435 TaxID=2720081 RepID=UPI001BD6B94B|nr:HNH endonuclease signature motif containing protein [Glaciihabitans sp. dw_435]